MCLQCTGWVFGGYFIHFLAMYLQCTCWVHRPLPPVRAAQVADVRLTCWVSRTRGSPLIILIGSRVPLAGRRLAQFRRYEQRLSTVFTSEKVADAFFLAFLTLFTVFLDYLMLYNVGPKIIQPRGVEMAGGCQK